MNNFFINSNDYITFLYQIFVYSFIHGGFLHLFFNSFFIYIFGNQIEENIGSKNFLLFFILNTLFLSFCLLYFSPYSTTVGISGFAMAILSFYTLKLKEIGNPDYKGGITGLVINILIGFSDKISLVGHLFGGVFGVIFFYVLKLFKKYE
ncbi:MAG: rhomboid family intramembrane serine protease [Candidatus Gracilibacteria bacterium]|nr:rhomboid family intramembrane serine protease [Candidatus Gracilibacteria bacterium]